MLYTKSFEGRYKRSMIVVAGNVENRTYVGSDSGEPEMAEENKIH